MQVLDCKDDWSLKSIRSVQAHILANDSGARRLSLDCSAVTSCDLTGVQLLAAAFRGFAEAGRSLSVAGLSPAMEQALARAGLALSPAGDALICGGN